MASVIIVEKKCDPIPGWTYFWKCPDCGEEIRKFEYGQMTVLECYKCRKKIYRQSLNSDEWETK